MWVWSKAAAGRRVRLTETRLGSVAPSSHLREEYWRSSEVSIGSVEAVLRWCLRLPSTLATGSMCPRAGVTRRRRRRRRQENHPLLLHRSRSELLAEVLVYSLAVTLALPLSPALSIVEAAGWCAGLPWARSLALYVMHLIGSSNR